MEPGAEIAEKIIADVSKSIAGSGSKQRIAKKIARGTASYADALAYAQESGRAMAKSMGKRLPELLTDGKLYRKAAEQAVRRPMEYGAKDVIDVAADIQNELNTLAEIGIKAIRPDINQDQIEGIIRGIVNAEDYQKGQDTFLQQVLNFLEGTVDDCVRENADFQYEAGLSPKIERRADANCCKWCSKLEGVYEYADVKNYGNDVFRRHKNCHCLVLYNPGNGSKRRQNVHTRAWEDEGRKQQRAELARQLAEEIRTGRKP